MSHPNFTQPKKAPTPSTITNNEQLLVALVASLKLLLVALSCVVLFAVLFVKALVGFGLVVLQAGNLFLGWMISLVASVDEVKAFALFLVATTTR